MTLTVSEEGTIFAGEFPAGQVMLNDNGTITQSTTSGFPFPMALTEDDPVTFIFQIASGHANDRYSAYALVEEWLVV